MSRNSGEERSNGRVIAWSILFFIIIALIIPQFIQPPSDICGPHFEPLESQEFVEVPGNPQYKRANPPDVNIHVESQKPKVGEVFNVTYRISYPSTSNHSISTHVYLESVPGVYVRLAKIRSINININQTQNQTQNQRVSIAYTISEFNKTSPRIFQREDVRRSIIIPNFSLSPGQKITIRVEVCSLTSGHHLFYPYVEYSYSDSIQNDGPLKNTIDVKGSYPLIPWISHLINNRVVAVIVGVFAGLITAVVIYISKLVIKSL